MYLRYIILKAICVSLCLATLPDPSEESAKEFTEHVLRIPYSDRVLNTVLGRLRRCSEQEISVDEANSKEADCDETPEALPEYTETLLASQERRLRQLGAQKHYPICHLERKIRMLNTNEYEYRPAYYEEVKCSMKAGEEVSTTNEICSSLGFSCVQWNKTIHLTRRRYASDCWETRTMVIPAGCECMWPSHRLGDITLHV